MAAAQRARWAKINGTAPTDAKPGKKKRKMSAAGRAAIVAGQKARWAKIKGNDAAPEPAKAKRDRRSSPATRAKLAAAAKARWAKARAAGKTAL